MVALSSPRLKLVRTVNLRYPKPTSKLGRKLAPAAAKYDIQVKLLRTLAPSKYSHGSNLASRQRHNANLYSVLFLATNGGGNTVVRRHDGKKPEDGLGGGQPAWKVFGEKYDAVGNAARQELYEESAKTKTKTRSRSRRRFIHIRDSASRRHDMGGAHFPPSDSVTLYSTPSRLITTTSCATSASGTACWG